MDRSLLSLFGHGFLGFTALSVAALGLVWSSPGSPGGGGAKPEDDWRLLEPISDRKPTRVSGGQRVWT